MNKKSLTTICLLTVSLMGAFQSMGQCTPNKNLKSPGFYPPQIDTGKVNKSYNSVIQAKVPKDTQVVFLGNTVNVTIDSIIVKQVLGLPSGFSFNCNNPRCKFLADSVGCTVIKGNPTTGQVGVYPLKFITRSYGKISGSIPISQQDTIRRFVLVIEGVSGMRVLKMKGFTIYPVPAKDLLNMYIPAEAGEVSKMEIYDLMGQYVSASDFNSQNNRITTVDIKKLQSGMYFLKTETSVGVTYARFVKE